MRADMEAAMAELGEDIETEETHEVETQATEEATEETSTAGGEASAEAAEGVEPTPEGAGEPEAAGRPVTEESPPVDWSPTVKEKWAELPEDVRGAIVERERHVNQVLQDTTNERHLASQFVQTAEPYRAMMAAEGVDHPIQAFQGLLATTAKLAMGSPQQKAQQIAGLIKHYGVDITTLDHQLAGLPLPEGGQQAAPAPDPRLDYVFNRMQQAEQFQSQAVNQEAHTSVEQFAADAKNEFYPTVRHTMADILDMKASRGETCSLNDAYTMACAMHPEIASVLAARTVSGAAQDQQGMMAGKKAAAGSISGDRGAESGSLENLSLRETIAAQMDDSGRI
jgi:hypothetical protein